MAKVNSQKPAAVVATVDWALLPNLLTPDDLVAVLRVPKQTIYAWSSQGLLDSCKVRCGKHVRFLRDKFIELMTSGGPSNE